MPVLSLDQLAPGTVLQADLVVIGGGPAGLAVAREFAGTRADVIVLESGGRAESEAAAALNRVEQDGEWSALQAERRAAGHGPLAASWRHHDQPYGVRARVLGGASHYWAGKSAIYDAIDFARRPWVAMSGWPIAREALDPYYARAAEWMNLGPNVYDEGLWAEIGGASPEPAIDRGLLRDFFWQFARSRTDQFEAMRFGPAFLAEHPANVRLVLDATATALETDEAGARVTAVRVASTAGGAARVEAPRFVLAASGIENARLLLASTDRDPAGIGNRHDTVGRWLLDHPATAVAHWERADAATAVRRFGFRGVQHRGRVHMYMHGLALSPELQEREGLLNAALFLLEEQSPDDPLLAFKRLAKRDWSRWTGDLATIATSPLPIAKGLGIKAFQSDRVPERVKTALINAVVRWNPNFAVRETLNRGVQYKLLGVRVEGISEQLPDAANRVTLSHARDALGVPVPRVRWAVDDTARRSLARLGELLAAECARTGLPVPTLPEWIREGRPDEAPVIDMAHTLGTTRMSDDPKAGVVDADCRVHGIANLFVAGGSVIPTGGHANPTLTIVALAMRLADRLKAQGVGA
jgi:choline dehydrogenase-like flavoprotein